MSNLPLAKIVSSDVGNYYRLEIFNGVKNLIKLMTFPNVDMGGVPQSAVLPKGRCFPIFSRPTGDPSHPPASVEGVHSLHRLQ